MQNTNHKTTTQEAKEVKLLILVTFLTLSALFTMFVYSNLEQGETMLQAFKDAPQLAIYYVLFIVVPSLCSL